MMRYKIIVNIILIAAALTGSAPTAYGGKEPMEEQMKEIYHIDNTLPKIEGVEYPVKKKIDYIFAVPEKNAVGTNSLNNAITLIRFNNEKLKYDVVRKDFLKYVSGGSMVFMPEFSKDTIGYSQTRGFLLFNIKTGDFKDLIIGKILGIDIDDVTVINADKNLFLFQLSYLLDINEEIKVLKLLDLSKDEPIELASHDIEKRPLHAKLDKTTFYFTENDGKRTLHALDQNLKPVHHPLLNLFNTEALESRDFELPTVHPNLPLAVFSEEYESVAEKLTTWVAVWREDKDMPVMYKILSKTWSGYFQFSLDGRWLLFKNSTLKEDMPLMMPVNAELPHFMGKPILLDYKEKMPEWELNHGDVAWISDPLSLVMTIGDAATGTGEGKLIKWDLSDAEIYRNQE